MQNCACGKGHNITWCIKWVCSLRCSFKKANLKKKTKIFGLLDFAFEPHDSPHSAFKIVAKSIGRELSQDTSQNDVGSAGLSGGCLRGPRILILLTGREVGGYRRWSLVGPTLDPKPSGYAACVSCCRLLPDR